MTKKRKHSSGDDVKGDEKGHTSGNPLLEEQSKFLDSLSDQERNDFFSESLTPSRRAELWMEQAELGERLVNSYSWATPDARAIRILKHFAPIIELGSGQGYWLQVMKKFGIDAVGYDLDPEKGGKILQGTSQKSHCIVRKGGPKVLERSDNLRRTLFLCYPDETIASDDSPDSKGKHDPPRSLGSSCLQHYSGEYVIHVGELFLDSTLSMDQAPWGRSSSPDFQEQLAAQFHCVLKVGLPSWLHVRDTLSVWKRSKTCSMVFEADEGDEDGDEEYEYRYVSPSFLR